MGEEPEGRFAPNGKFVYVTSENTEHSAIDVVTATLIKTFKVGRRPRSVAFVLNIPVPTSKLKMMRRHRQDTAKHETKPFCSASAEDQNPCQYSPDGATLRQHRQAGIKLSSIATTKVTASLNWRTPWGIAPLPRHAFSANGPSNDVSVVDLANSERHQRFGRRRAMGNYRAGQLILCKTHGTSFRADRFANCCSKSWQIAAALLQRKFRAVSVAAQ